MQLNTTAALATAVLSAVIGFGLAFYIERKLSGGMQKKSQKILTSIAMISFGYGLMATLNEVIGFPLQGLSIRYDKLAVFVAANILFLPIILLAIAKFIGVKNKNFEIPASEQNSEVKINYFKYLVMLVGGMLVVYLGYAAVGTSPSGSTYDFYGKIDSKNCNSPFADKPYVSMKFSFKKETNEVFVTAKMLNAEEKTQMIKKLENCSVLDAKNWTCGGEWKGSLLTPKYMFIDGDLSYEEGFNTLTANCPRKFVKR
jgi:hypothetical protein